MAQSKTMAALKMMMPYLAMIVLQFGYGGMSIITKLALNEGAEPARAGGLQACGGGRNCSLRRDLREVGVTF
ncbi:unnamed protein product [Linum trigynum]